MRNVKIVFIGPSGTAEFECKLSSLPLREEKIIEKSVELFNDNEPCIIHRSFVIKKLLLEIDEHFSEALSGGKGQIMWDGLPLRIRELLHTRGEVVSLRLDL